MSPTDASDSRRKLSTQELEPILAVTRRLAAAFDLEAMLTEVVRAAQLVLAAERCSVWLYDAGSDELVLRVSSDIEDVRIPAGSGIVGSCARSRSVINVPDCYADPRFNPELDRRTNYRTRCMLSLPLIDHHDKLVGVVQVLNKIGGTFDADDEALATVLAAQCAVALQRAQMTAAVIEGEKLRQQMELARSVQMSTLPVTMPDIPGYDVHGVFDPADATGGDTFDLALINQGLLVVLGDATGHGLAPALHVTQMHAMLRMALRMGADLETAFTQVNNQLAALLPDDRFITAFIGLLDVVAHALRFQSAGQAPILLYQAGTGKCVRHVPTSFPLAAMTLTRLRDSVTVLMQPGDILVLLSDGIYEYENASAEQFGEERVARLMASLAERSAESICTELRAAVTQFAAGAPQEDDITMVIVKRTETGPGLRFAIKRSIDALDGVFAFTGEAFATLKIDASLKSTVEFVIEELFTNMVKYSQGGAAQVDLGISPITGGVEVSLTDHGVDEFDVTAAKPVDIAAPIEVREPGGLGLHLVMRMVDSISYQYNQDKRESRIVFRKTLAQTGAQGSLETREGKDADN